MKKYFSPVIIFLLLVFGGKCFGQSGQWIWMKGDSTYNAWYYAPALGVEDSTYHPNAIAHGIYWQDDSDRFWIFGGLTYDPYDYHYQYTDYLWRFNPATNNWALMKKSPFINSLGVYGTEGIPDSANYPGARRGS